MVESQAPSKGWLASIDAVYSLFENQKAALLYPELSPKVETAVRLCEDVIRDVGWPHCALSFNGGKDCTVLVHILSAVLRRLNAPSSSSQPLPPIPSLYITCPSPFPTVEKFIGFSSSPIHGYNLNLVTVAGGMKEGIRAYLDGEGKHQIGLGTQVNEANGERDIKSDKRDIRAMFVGTRRDDPHGPQLSPRAWTDADWPRVERIHPILNWTYKEVWNFLRCSHLANPDAHVQSGFDREELTQQHGVAGGGDEGVPYCLLYEQGYTSLGATYNTHPNPILAADSPDEGGLNVVGDGTAKGRWKPAYMLLDGRLERAGREGNSAPAEPKYND